MPEGPEVRIVADHLEQHVGRIFNSAEILEWPGFKHRFVRNGIPGFEKIKNGFTLKSVICKGKLLVLQIEAGDEALSLICTLGMSGSWMTLPDDKELIPTLSSNHGRVLFRGTPCLAFVDQRSFGTLSIVTRDATQKRLKKIGWDLLQAPMKESDWSKLQSKIGKKPIGEVLMKQNRFAGIGNIYKAEVLYEAGLHPKTLVSDLDSTDWAKINQITHQILTASYAKRGSSTQSFHSDGKKGTFHSQLKIYKKKKCPQDHEIKSVEQAKRTTWYCPVCQPERKKE